MEKVQMVKILAEVLKAAKAYHTAKEFGLTAKVRDAVRQDEMLVGLEESFFSRGVNTNYCVNEEFEVNCSHIGGIKSERILTFYEKYVEECKAAIVMRVITSPLKEKTKYRNFGSKKTIKLKGTVGALLSFDMLWSSVNTPNRLPVLEALLVDKELGVETAQLAVETGEMKPVDLYAVINIFD